MIPVHQSSSQLSSLPITSFNSNGPLVPDSYSKREAIDKVAHGFFHLGAHVALGWSLDTSLPEILTGEDTAFDHKPSKESYLGPKIQGPDLLPSFLFPYAILDLNIVGFLDAKHPSIRVSPSLNIQSLLEPDEPIENFFLKSLLVCQLYLVKFVYEVPAPSPIKSPLLPEVVHLYSAIRPRNFLNRGPSWFVTEPWELIP